MHSYQPSIDSNLLSTFLAVVDFKTVSAASRALHLSQPAVTSQIRKLESEMKAQLFVRSVHGMETTEQGKRLCDYARRVHGLLEEASREVLKGQETQGTLVLAASTTIASYVLPPLLSAYSERNPKVSIQLTVGNTNEVLDKVRNRLVPLGLVEGLSKAAQLRLEPYVEDELVLAAAPRIAARIRRVSDIAAFPLIVREAGSGTRAVVERALKGAGLSKKMLSSPFELGGTETIKGALMLGMGVGFLSRWSIQNEVALGKLVPIPLKELSVKRYFHWTLPAGTLTGISASFWDFAVRQKPRLTQR